MKTTRKFKYMIMIGLLLSVITNQSAAQMATFIKDLNTSTNIMAMRLLMYPDSTYFGISPEGYVAGVSSGIIVVKYSKDHQMLWSKSFGDTLNNGLTGVFINSQGNLVITGNNFSPNLYYNQYLLKLDTAGNVISFDHNLNPMIAMCEDYNGNYMFQFAAQTANSATIVKTDTSGNTIWQSYFKLNSAFTTPTHIFPLQDGYHVFGFHFLTGLGFTHPFIAKFDTAGNYLWSQSYIDSARKGTSDVISLSDGGYLIVGADNAINGTNIGVLFTRIDSVGNLLWCKKLDTPEQDNISQAILTQDSKVIIAGFTGSVTGGGMRKYFMLQTDTLANPEWSYYYRTESSVYNPDILKLSDGYLYTMRQGQPGLDVLMIKMDLNGLTHCTDTVLSWTVTPHTLTQYQPVYLPGSAPQNVRSPKPFNITSISIVEDTLCQTMTGLPGWENDQTISMTMFPSPLTAGDELHISANTHEPYDLVLFDMQGRIIFNIQGIDQDETIITPALNEGIYLVRIVTETGAATKRVVLCN